MKTNQLYLYLCYDMQYRSIYLVDNKKCSRLKLLETASKAATDLPGTSVGASKHWSNPPIDHLQTVQMLSCQEGIRALRKDSQEGIRTLRKGSGRYQHTSPHSQCDQEGVWAAGQRVAFMVLCSVPHLLSGHAQND